MYGESMDSLIFSPADDAPQPQVSRSRVFW